VFSRNYHTLHSHLLLLQYKPTHKDNDHCFSCSVLQYKPTRNSFSCSVLPLNLFSPSIQTRTQLLLLLLQSKLSCIFRSISLRETKWFQTVFSPWINWCRRYDDFGDACIWNGDARKVAENIILWSLDLWFSCFCSGQFFLLKLLVFKIFSFLPLIRLCWSKLITHTRAKKMNESKIEREKVGENSVYWIEWKKKSVITRYKTMYTIYRFS
jgi:hypothetical protein